MDIQNKLFFERTKYLKSTIKIYTYIYIFNSNHRPQKTTDCYFTHKVDKKVQNEAAKGSRTTIFFALVKAFDKGQIKWEENII